MAAMKITPAMMQKFMEQQMAAQAKKKVAAPAKKVAAPKAAKVAAPKAAKVPKAKRAKVKSTRVNFDMETSSYVSASEACRKNEKSVAAAGRLFLEAVAELGANGAKSEIARAAKAIISQALPEGSRTPNGMGKKAAAPAKKVVAAPTKKVVAAPKVAAKVAAPLVARPVAVSARPVGMVPAPKKFIFTPRAVKA